MKKIRIILALATAASGSKELAEASHDGWVIWSGDAPLSAGIFESV